LKMQRETVALFLCWLLISALLIERLRSAKARPTRLSELMLSLRRELADAAAQRAADKQPDLFDVTEVDLEVSVEAASEGSFSGIPGLAVASKTTDGNKVVLKLAPTERAKPRNVAGIGQDTPIAVNPKPLTAKGH